MLVTLDAVALRAVEEAVQAVVSHDEERLAAMMAADFDDLYLWTRDYGAHGVVDLVLPPGSPAEWEIDGLDMHDGRKFAAVAMWTRQEGRSDLTLELHLHPDGDGRWTPQILDLHVP